ncbi:hypothetical protein Terro_2514 [Terriglobus roseus DSM 18391]|uniref:Phage protein D n=2 Tax=Terriglobus roseus TaxID=392734 RepID=I3ZHP2_TERRK|nr:hypothetical protein [Terriglobus roseus]AFL88760.1 hypothetical protein Terro_2514 [Terriglobus roseus DSM 18391]
MQQIFFTLLIGPMVPVPAPAAVSNALQSAQVTVASGQRSGFQLLFNVATNSLLNTTLLPAGLFDPGIRVILMAIVNGIPNVLMDGIVMRQEFAPSNQPGQSTLTVTGEDVSVMMGLIDLKGIPYPAMSVELRVAAILAKYAIYGLVPLIIPSLFPDLNLPMKSIAFQKGTDLDYINQLAKENGYVFYLSPGPAPGVNLAYFGPEIRIGVPQPALNINMDAATNVESLSFSLDGSTREQLAVLIQEPFTKLNIPVPIPSLSPYAPPLAAKSAPALHLKFLEGAAKLDPLKAMIQGIGKATEANDAITASGSLDVLRYGRVLGARQLVGVRGSGPAYDGLYFVKSVTHNLNPRKREYKQSFNLARNGLISLTPRVVP